MHFYSKLTLFLFLFLMLILIRSLKINTPKFMVTFFLKFQFLIYWYFYFKYVLCVYTDMHRYNA